MCPPYIYLYIFDVTKLNVPHKKNPLYQKWGNKYRVRVMVCNVTFNNISEYLEKTTDLPQVTDKLYHIMLY